MHSTERGLYGPNPLPQPVRRHSFPRSRFSIWLTDHVLNSCPQYAPDMPPILVARRPSEGAHRPKRVQHDFLPPNLPRQHPTFEKCGRKSHAKNSQQNQCRNRGEDSPRNPISKVDEPRDKHESRKKHEPRDACPHTRCWLNSQTSAHQTIAPSRLGYCMSNSRMTTRRSGGANGFGMNR